MIPESTVKLLVGEDWKKIYQSFKNADFKSYDFDTIKRVMISYLRENYPEDFNDYIESSEYVALIDLIAFLGQNLSFRIDLNARENFLETAQRRDSILRLAQLISYNPSRNVPASGLLKVVGISTTDSVLDANGINLSDVTILWNDSNNPDWYQQFVNIFNSASSTAFGRSTLTKTLNGINTELYRLNSSNEDVPLYSFTKSVNGTSMAFEVISSNFQDEDFIYEDAPRPANSFNLIYQNDNQGSGSVNTGFFCFFKQGTLSLANFSIDNPVPNEIVGINTPNINNTDVWLWQLDRSGNFDRLWTKVSSNVGNNVIYNSVSKLERKLYSITSRADDQIDLNFADGVFGDLPKGEFRLFYRQSNGLNYIIKPEQLSGIVINVPYTNSSGQQHTLSLTLSLQYTVSNSLGTETDESIRTKAPQNYYLQNRMITGEDYNIGPLNAGGDILKVKSVNRISSGISRYYELTDVSGRYSNTNIFCTDGILYKEPSENIFDFSFTSRNQIFSVIKNDISNIVNDTRLKSFFYDNYSKPELNSLGLFWKEVNKTPGQSRGYFYNSNGNYKVGPEYTDNNLKYLVPGSKIKFVAPDGKYFDTNNDLQSLERSESLGFDLLSFVDQARENYSFETYYIKTVDLLPLYMSNSLYTTGVGDRYGLSRDPDFSGLKYWVDLSLSDNLGIKDEILRTYFFGATTGTDTLRSQTQNKIYFTVSDVISGYSPVYRPIPREGKSYLWVTVKQVIGDGASLLDDGTAPVILSSRVPSDAVPVAVLTKYPSILGYAIENEIANFCVNYKNFGLTINNITRSWEFILNSNLDIVSPFNLNSQENTQDQNLDSSWLLSFVWDGKKYRITSRILGYIFESENETAFFVDKTNVNYDFTTNKIIKDTIEVLPINLSNNSNSPESIGENNLWQIDDIVIKADGYINNKQVYVSFYDYNNLGEFENPESFENIVGNDFVYFKKTSYDDIFELTRDPVIELESEDLVTNEMKIDGQLFYFYASSENVMKYWSSRVSSLIFTDQYIARRGRSDLKFQYTHNSGDQRRIDPSKTNIIDIYLLTASYDSDYRNFVLGNITDEPAPPTTYDLEKNYGTYLNEIKSISDEIVFNPVRYKKLFGTKADLQLQATFKAVRNAAVSTNTNNLKNRILTLINEFFKIDYWDFGQTFHFSELATFIMNEMTPEITNFVIVPKIENAFGSLFEINCLPNEILISVASIDDIEIIDSITITQLQPDSILLTS